MSFTLTSDAFLPNQAIPVRHTCDGLDVSPPLAWSDQPENTASFVLIMDDPDAPTGAFTHWLMFNLPGPLHSLPEGVPALDMPPSGGIQGRNDFGMVGYSGPCPPRGELHHYRFTLYALDATPTLRPRATRQQVLGAVQGHTIAKAELIGTYQRDG